MKRLVIIPAKNEGKSIRKTLEQVKGYDVVVCDGGSKDTTCRIARKMGATVLFGRSGYGKVILNGFRYGLTQGYDQMIVMDCESHTFAEIVPHLDCGADVIAGLRKGEKKPWYRKIITQVGRKMMPQGVTTEIVDISNGFRAYSRRFVEHVLSLEMEEVPSYTFNSILAFNCGGFAVQQFPMSYIGGKSGLTLWELFKAWSYRVSYKIPEKSKAPIEPIEPTLEDVAAYLRMHHGPQFEMFCRRCRKRREDV